MKKIISCIFIALLAALCIGTVATFPVQEITKIISGYGGGVRGIVLTAMDTGTLGKKLDENVPLKENWITLLGATQRYTGMKHIVDKTGKNKSVCRMENGAVSFVIEENPALPEENVQSITNLKNLCDELGAESWFVSIPQKYCSTDNRFALRGLRDYSEDIAAYRKGLFADAGYQVLDIHEKMHEQGLDHGSMYFNTDHHWKAQSALWAAGEIARAMGLDNAMMDPSLYKTESYPGFFLGTEGTRVGSVYSPKDDLELLIPTFETDFLYESEGEVLGEGSYSDALLFRDHLNKGLVYCTFLNGDMPIATITNRMNPEGKHLLIFKDSYTDSMGGFLAMACGKVTLVDLRNNEGSVADLVKEYTPDIVCVDMTAKVFNENFCFD